MLPEFLWKAEILTGMLPAKTTQYSNKDKRKDTIYLFGAIEKVELFGIRRIEAISALIKYSYILDAIAEEVYNLDNIGKKVKLVYFPCNRPRFIIKSEEDRIYVFIPKNLIDDEW